MNTIAIDDTFRVLVTGNFALSAGLKQRVDSVWIEASRRNPQLFDGTVVAVTDCSANAIQCCRVPYSVFFAAQADVDLRETLNLNVLGVSGITWFGDKILIGKRRSVSQHNNHLELVPSGSLTCSDSEIEVDYRAHLLQELEEESGISGSKALSCQPFLLAIDVDAGITDICCSVQVDEDTLPADCTREYDELRLLSREELRELQTTRRKKWVGTSLVIFDWLDAKAHQ